MCVVSLLAGLSLLESPTRRAPSPSLALHIAIHAPKRHIGADGMDSVAMNTSRQGRNDDKKKRQGVAPARTGASAWHVSENAQPRRRVALVTLWSGEAYERIGKLIKTNRERFCALHSYRCISGDEGSSWVDRDASTLRPEWQVLSSSDFYFVNVRLQSMPGNQVNSCAMLALLQTFSMKLCARTRNFD